MCGKTNLGWILGIVAALAAAAPGQDTLVGLGSTWRYLDDGSDQGGAWRAIGFDDAGWSSGPAQLGYGDGDEATVVGYGSSSSNKFPTTYFRHGFTVADADAVGPLELGVVRDDGVIVYLNGTEIFRSNMPAGDPDYLTHASSAISGSGEDALNTTPVDPALLVTGANVLAVEIHQANLTSSDISFDLELTTVAPGVVRGPYLQKASATSMTVRWRTGVPTDSVLRYGTEAGNLDQVISNPAITGEHAVTASGLAPHTRYYYSVGDSDNTWASGSDTYFVTHPVAGTAAPTRIWILGDSGTADANAAAVRDAYVSFNGDAHADVWLMLGDNAYNDGTDAEYQAAVFDMYPDSLRNSVLWSTLGNHDGYTADSATQSGPYYDIFSFPVSGESGGVGSGTEAYYSFDYANIHFVCLDSYETSRSSAGAMANWLREDLADTTQEWIIAFWHHPPYSKGSHNSDTEARMVEMRQVFNPIFEDYGVDLVLGGHSHSYERSVLIDGHYGTSDTFTAAQVIDGGDGDPAGGGYLKEAVPHDGAVYAVAGSSGKISGGALDHPVMIRNLNQLGSMVIDIDGNRLDGRFLNDSIAVTDHFRITHELPVGVPAAPDQLVAGAESSTAIGLAWRENADNEDGLIVQRSLDQVQWVEVADLAPDSTAHVDSGLSAGGTYFYRVFAYNAGGDSPASNIASAITDTPPATDYLASSESTTRGTVSGSFADTAVDDGVAEALTEELTGNKSRNHRSELEHVWIVNLPSGGASAVLNANAWSGGSSDNDAFRFDYSSDGGASWAEAFTVSDTSSDHVAVAVLPAGTGGELRVRVTDTDRTRRNADLDTLFVDELFVTVEFAAGDPPAVPGIVSIGASGSGQVDLSWENVADESGYQVERSLAGAADWLPVATTAADETSFSDTSVVPSTSYDYRVSAFNGSGSLGFSDPARVTTPAGIALAASGSKEKGKAVVELTWSGADGLGTLVVFRDGQAVDTVSGGSGTYVDRTGVKGSPTFVYQLCDEGDPAQCSNTVTVGF